MKKKILIICSHPDDEILGCGGTIAKHINNKDVVKVIYTHEGCSSRYNIIKNEIIKKKINLEIKERQEMAIKVSKFLKFKIINFYNYCNLDTTKFNLLDLIKKIDKDIKTFKPTIIYTHNEFDLNEDHRNTFKATINACRPNDVHNVNEIYTFETPSVTEWSNSFYQNKFNPDYFVDIDKFFEKKMKALKIYNKELRKFPHPRSKEFIKALATYRGGSVYLNKAESFKTIRRIF